MKREGKKKTKYLKVIILTAKTKINNFSSQVREEWFKGREHIFELESCLYS